MDEEERLLIDAQIEWHSKAKQGCLFAQFLHKDSSNLHSVKRIVLSDGLNANTIQQIKDNFNQLVKDLSNQIVSFIIPAITTNTELADFVSFISNNEPTWLIDAETEKNLALYKIRVPIEGQQDSSKTQVYSWMLTFGPFEHYANTRKSPYFEVLLVTKSKQQLKEIYSRYSHHKQFEDSQERKGNEFDAHLADLYIEGLTNDIPKDKKYWNGSIVTKKAVLKGESDFNAKARVTLTLQL